MPKGSLPNGDLAFLEDCYIVIGTKQIKFRILPDISDQKSANYADEAIIGRAFPVKTYSHSENRAIAMELHFIVLQQSDIQENLNALRLIQSACYPRDGQGGSPYRPPPICRLVCGKLLGNNGVCAVLKNYNVKFPTDQVWDQDSYLPYKFDVSTSWEVVYASSNLPGNDRIARYGA